MIAAALLRRCAAPQLVAARRAFCAPPTVRPLSLLLYHYVDDVLEARQPFRSAHLAAARAAVVRGELLLGGALNDPVDGGVLCFTGSEAAESFAETDPYVVNGIVTEWTVREWSVVVGSLASKLPPVPPFRASYEWQRVASDVVLPAGLQVELPLDGVGLQRARIPPEWSLRLNIKDPAGYSFTFDMHHDVCRSTTIGELRRAAARQATRAESLGDVSAERISMTIDGRLGELDDAQTVEEVDLFTRAGELKVVVRGDGEGQ